MQLERRRIYSFSKYNINRSIIYSNHSKKVDIICPTATSGENQFYIPLREMILLYRLLRKTIRSRWFMLSFDEGGNQNIYSYICSRPSFIYYVDSLLFLSDRSNRNMKPVCQIPSLPFHAPAAKNQR
jgi:hypothetical protein